MEEQPIVQPPTQPIAPQPPKKQGMNRLLIVGAGIAMLIIAIGLIVGIRAYMKKTTPTTNITDSGTHTKASVNDLKFGDNRALNACNILPVSLYESVYGKQTGWKLVQEENQIGDVANNLITEDSGLGGMSCNREGEGDVDSLVVRLTGFRSAEAAKKFYDSTGNNDKKDLQNPTAIAGLDAVGGARDNDFTVVGVHNNYVYFVEKGGFFKDAVDANGMVKITTVAKQVVKNMDDTSISSRPSTVPKLTFAGKQLTDACELFSSQDFAQQVVTKDKDITDKYAFAKIEAPTRVRRAYYMQVTPPASEKLAISGFSCARQSGSRPQAINLSKEEALDRINDELLLPKVNALVNIDYVNDLEEAQHRLEVSSKDGGQAVNGVGDAAFVSKVGVSGELSQLIFRKGITLVTIQIQTSGGSCRDAAGCIASTDQYVPLAQSIAAKLP